MPIERNESNNNVLIKILEKIETEPRMNIINSSTFLGYIMDIIFRFFDGELSFNLSSELDKISKQCMEIERLENDKGKIYDEEEGEEPKVYENFITTFVCQFDSKLEDSEEKRIQSLKELCDLYKKMRELYDKNDAREKYIVVMASPDQYFDDIVQMFNENIKYKWHKCIAIIKVLSY